MGFNSLIMLQKLHNIFGEDRFAKAVIDGDILERTIKEKKLSLCLYILSLGAVKNLLDPLSEKETIQQIICRLFYILLAECEDEDMVKQALKELNYSTDIMIKYLSKKYDGNLTVITKLMRDSTLDRMKRSQAILKEQLFVDVLLQSHHKSMNALEYSLKNETNGSYFEYFLSFDAVKQFYKTKDCN